MPKHKFYENPPRFEDDVIQEDDSNVFDKEYDSMWDDEEWGKSENPFNDDDEFISDDDEFEDDDF